MQIWHKMIEWFKELLKSTDRDEIEAWEKDILGELDNGDHKR